MSRIAHDVGDELRTIPGVRTVVCHIGRAITGDQVVGINAAQFWVSLDRTADYRATMDRIEAVAAGHSEFVHGVLTYPEQQIMEAQALTDDENLVVRLYGHDMATLRTKAEEVRQALAGIDGVAEAEVDYPVEEPKVQVKVNLEAA
ncbi:MAG: AcrB/AcrD/AcrF family protein, partial [Planctomycetota bacterium]|nr:AcrB/AcrD/AcrF family protein [Planctomycetota bacterium]